MITMVKADGVAERQQLEAMRRRAAETGAEIARSASEIMEAVRLRGYEAVREYSLKFDGAEPREITKEELEAAAGRIDPALLQAFQRSAEHIRAYQQELLRQVKSRTWESPIPGGTVGQLVRGLARVGIYVPGGRAAYSFCVCPGGEVVAAASEAERVVTNGMSEFARDKENINGGLLVNVTPEDYGGAEDPLAGIAFQRKLESAAYALGGGDYRAPAQRVGDFLAGRPSVGPGRVHPSYRPGVTWTDLRRCLPPFVADTIAGALPLLGQKLRGYDDPDAVLTAVESRSSSPVRIPRDGTCQSSLRGLYPCGEGAGYAGGILSAAADGMHCAEQLCQSIQKESDCL